MTIKRGAKVCIFWFNSFVKLHAKICTRCCNINKNRSGLLCSFCALLFCDKRRMQLN